MRRGRRSYVLKLLKTGVFAASLAAWACAGGNTPATGKTETAADAPGAAASTLASEARASTDSKNSAAAAEMRQVTIPAGTELPIVLDTAVASDTSRAEQAVHAHLARAVVVHGETALPQGSR